MRGNKATNGRALSTRPLMTRYQHRGTTRQGAHQEIMYKRQGRTQGHPSLTGPVSPKKGYKGALGQGAGRHGDDQQHKQSQRKEGHHYGHPSATESAGAPKIDKIGLTARSTGRETKKPSSLRGFGIRS